MGFCDCIIQFHRHLTLNLCPTSDNCNPSDLSITKSWPSRRVDWQEQFDRYIKTAVHDRDTTDRWVGNRRKQEVKNARISFSDWKKNIQRHTMLFSQIAEFKKTRTWCKNINHSWLIKILPAEQTESTAEHQSLSVKYHDNAGVYCVGTSTTTRTHSGAWMNQCLNEPAHNPLHDIRPPARPTLKN